MNQLQPCRNRWKMNSASAVPQSLEDEPALAVPQSLEDEPALAVLQSLEDEFSFSRAAIAGR